MSLNHGMQFLVRQLADAYGRAPTSLDPKLKGSFPIQKKHEWEQKKHGFLGKHRVYKNMSVWKITVSKKRACLGEKHGCLITWLFG